MWTKDRGAGGKASLDHWELLLVSYGRTLLGFRNKHQHYTFVHSCSRLFVGYLKSVSHLSRHMRYSSEQTEKFLPHLTF